MSNMKVNTKYVSSVADTNAQCFAAIIWCWTLGGASDTMAENSNT